ncbi:MAG: hypothetical protein EHM77_06695, partial [Planctomycetaceae bacterium]
WDEAMKVIFSPETMRTVKKTVSLEVAELLPESFDSFFDHYQDDTWIISDNHEEHLAHCESVILAFKLHDIKISPDKSTFFAESLKVLGVQVRPCSAELALDAVKAKSILTWEKPDSLYTLQSRLYSLNYWQKFIPNLSELKFPLNQILKSGVFSWNEQANEAWENIKSVITMDIRLTIPLKDDQLVMTTDASKVAISCILWVEKGDDLKVVGCYSKLFSHVDTLKSIYYKETYAMVEAFKHFRPYLVSSSKPIVVFTDARSLMWVSRNREFSIACNGLVNKLASLQLEIPYVVYSVPGEINYLADLFSRSFKESRFLDKTHFNLSKVQAGKIPPVTDPCVLTEEVLYHYFSNPLNPEHGDKYPRTKNKISNPKPIKSLYKMFKDCTPEQKYYSAIRLLKGWNDGNILKNRDVNLNVHEIIEKRNPKVYENFSEKMVNDLLGTHYADLDKVQSEKLRKSLLDNFRNVKSNELDKSLKDSFLKTELELEKAVKSSVVETKIPVSKDEMTFQNDHVTVRHNQSTTVIYYTITDGCQYFPKCSYNSPGIDLPVQESITLSCQQREVLDTKIKILIPANYYGQLQPRSSSAKLELSIHSGVIDN